MQISMVILLFSFNQPWFQKKNDFTRWNCKIQPFFLCLCLLCSIFPFQSWHTLSSIRSSNNPSRWHLWCVLADNRQWRFWGCGHQRWYPPGRWDMFEDEMVGQLKNYGMRKGKIQVWTAVLVVFLCSVDMGCVCCLICLLYIAIPSTSDVPPTCST